MKRVSTTLFLILIVAAPAFSLSGRNDETVADESNYKEVNGFSGYLTLDDYPYEKVQRWLDPVGIATLSAMPTMKRGKTMGAFVELRGCQQNARGMCNTRVNYTIYKPDGSIFATRAVRQKELLWKKHAPLASDTSYPKTRNRLKKQGRKMGGQSEGLARMHFKLGKDDPVGEYKVKAKVTDSNANISFEIELNFYLR